ncbi:hypothetical protein AQJ11_32950 [Streptomyces corchorusii]|uniref:DUF6879 domain-containing protein n=1 Tax=Streptomyces corchorusii TaxID=1903 RepID=A0A101PVV1_STRCK|nr:hypothetical protein AQJ11_32950 [Streptomyces corchorusii]
MWWKVLVSLAAGGLASVVTKVADPEAKWQVGVGIFVGGCLLILQLLGDLINQVRDFKAVLPQHQAQTQETVVRSFARISEATRFYSEMERLPPDGVAALATSAVEVVSRGPDIMRRFAEELMRRLAVDMEALRSGGVDCAGENHDWLLALTNCATDSIDSTSTLSLVDRDFWSSEPAGRYLQAQREAIARGVTVRRLFLVADSTDVDDELRHISREQEELGIQTRVVVRNRLPQALRRGLVDEFVVFDRATCYEIEQDQRHVNTSTRVRSHENHVGLRTQRFAELWDAGVPTQTVGTPTGGSGAAGA